ncbi:predicted protein, partial [Verticillium alfalfae VaMs.102]
QFNFGVDDQPSEAFAQACMRHIDFDDWVAERDEPIQDAKFPLVVRWDVTAFDKFFRDYRWRHPRKTRQECVLDLVAQGFADYPVSSSVFRRCFMVGSVESTQAAEALQQTGRPLLSLAARQLGWRRRYVRSFSLRDENPEREGWQVLVKEIIRCKADLHASGWLVGTLRKPARKPIDGGTGKNSGEAISAPIPTDQLESY